jgi:predicted RNase H-like nuclease
MFVAGVDGCRAGWACFKVEVTSLATSVEVIDLPELLKSRPDDLGCLGIDIPIGLLDGSRSCDKKARELLGQPRGTSVFAAPCRAALLSASHSQASAVNRQRTGRGLSLQSFHIGPKIKQVDDTITPERQQWAFEVHPEVCFWALNQHRPMVHNKKTEAGRNERLNLLRTVFPDIQRHLVDRPPGIGKDDLLDAAAAAWTALRLHKGDALNVCQPESDEQGLAVTIYY